MTNLKEKLKKLENLKFNTKPSKFNVNLSEYTLVSMTLKYGRKSKRTVEFMVPKYDGEDYDKALLETAEYYIASMIGNPQEADILRRVSNVIITESDFYAVLDNRCVLGKIIGPYNLITLKYESEILHMILKYTGYYLEKNDIIDMLDNTDGYFLLFLIYTKYVANVALSYGRYIDDTDLYNGFKNDAADDCIWVLRTDVNNFISFVLGKRMIMKEWITDVLTKHKKYISKSHKPGSKTFLKIDSNTLDMLFENKNYAKNWSDLFSSEDPYKLEYLLNKIVVYVHSSINR